MLRSISPTDGKVLANYPLHSQDETKEIVHQVARSQQQWKQTDFSRRSALVKGISEQLLSRLDGYASLITREMGKPISQSRSEIEKCARLCDYYAENAGRFLSNEPVESAADESYIAYRPLGVVLAVMPWNFPFWQVFRFAIPAIMAGNAALLKHASNVTGSALAIESIFQRAGFPPNLFRTLKIKSESVAEVIEHPDVKAVTLTGSVGAGSSVAEKAGAALKKTVLELGGSDPYVVLKDADLDQAAKICAESRMLNGGQSCISAKRFIVVEDIYNSFLEKFMTRMKKKTMGDPFEDDTQLGPMAQISLRDELHQQVIKSLEAGAKCVLGGDIPDKDGAWYPPTVLVDVKPEMPAYSEELFGPVAAIIKAVDENDAVRIANDTVFGLGAAVFTKDISHGKYIAEHLMEAGNCFVNEMVQSDPRLPFGGIGHSGYGRELSWAGIREFTNMKTVFVKG
jgi:succinate-semialdehyde dehydrogenase / glutarate-semialdehyde dehydrogenase